MLTYIGCRWLAATQSFGDLILNALALEFAPWRCQKMTTWCVMSTGGFVASKSFKITTIQNHLQGESPNKKKHYGWILEAPQPGFSPD